jgi:tRNA pseudouridine13 synthase
VPDALPYATSGLAPIPARYKERPEDFAVEEVAAYEPRGEGDHVFFGIEKRGISTHEAVARIARKLGVAPHAIGLAGLKDAHALTRQVLSVEHVEPARVEALEIAGLRVLWTRRHVNKLRIGHLAGNRFRIRLRGIGGESEAAVRAVIDALAARGVPNYFGEQRFGARGDSWRVGRALVLGDPAGALAWICGRPGPLDHGAVARARELFDGGEYARAAVAWPGGMREQIRLCRAMARSGGDARAALRALPRQLMRLYPSAYQARLFNALLAERIGSFDRVEAGDLAWLHRSGAVFLVVDAAAETPRAKRFEISPSGPLFGERMTWPAGRPLEIERAVLAREGVDPALFSRRGALSWKGGRRSLRFEARESSVSSGADEHGAFVELAFALPPGCYATSVLREVVKGTAPPGER